MTRTSQTEEPPTTASVVCAGALTLAVAMGIGRFAFTPLLPLMMRDGLIDATVGAELAAANYLGYLAGALSAASLAGQALRLVWASLLAIALLTAAAGLASGELAWSLLRFGAGLASAWAMVGISSWSLTELARRGQGGLGALMFGGVGGGIILAGMLAWVSAGAGARTLWLQMAAAALLLTLGVVWLTRGLARRVAPRPSDPTTAAAPAGLPTGSWPLVICYGCAGLGYILPATFLPAMARSLIDDPQRFGLAWPLFGLAAWISAMVSAARGGSRRGSPLRTWALCQLAIGLGAAMPLLSRSGAAIALAALLVGSTFVLVTVIGLEQARALAPGNPAPLLGRMTASFALGQIAGPLMVRALSGLQLGAWGPLELGSASAATLMLATAGWLWRLGQTPAGLSAAPIPRG
jgi:hypothetical protein